jgi:hypothetical protein
MSEPGDVTTSSLTDLERVLFLPGYRGIKDGERMVEAVKGAKGKQLYYNNQSK